MGMLDRLECRDDKNLSRKRAYNENIVESVVIRSLQLGYIVQKTAKFPDSLGQKCQCDVFFADANDHHESSIIRLRIARLIAQHALNHNFYMLIKRKIEVWLALEEHAAVRQIDRVGELNRFPIVKQYPHHYPAPVTGPTL